jgi:hypothetical protein
VALVRLALENQRIKLSLAFFAKLHLEDLALFVSGDVECVVRTTAPSRHVLWTNDPEPRAHAGELIRDRFRIHNFKSGRAAWSDRLRCDSKP